MSSVESRDCATISQLLQHNPLPFNVEVVTGYVDDRDDGNRSRLLHPGTLLRVHFVHSETMFVGEAERDDKRFTLLLDDACKIELLPEIPELDDRVFATVRDVLEMVPRPKWIRVQESYDGGNDHNTVHKGEEFQDLYTGRYKGEPCMCGRLVSSKDGESGEVCLTLDTTAMFTTARSVKSFLGLAELAAKCDVGDELTTRVRVHSVKRHPREVPRPPVKARLLRLVEHKAAVCVDDNGRACLLPSSLSSVRLRLRTKGASTHCDDLASSLHSLINLYSVPRIGPLSLQPIFGPYPNVSKLSLNDPVCLYDEAAFLFPPAQCGLVQTQSVANTDAYQTVKEWGIRREMTARMYGLRDRVKKTAHRLELDLLQQQHSLRQEISDMRFFAWKESLGEQESVHFYHDVASKVDAREDQWFPHDDVISEDDLYYAVESTQDLVTDVVYEQPDLRKSVRVKIERQDSEMKEKVQQMRKENDLLAEMIQNKKDDIAGLEAAIVRCADLYQPSSHVPVDVRLLESMNSGHVTSLLNNIGLHVYAKMFSNENVEGYLLSGCDAEYLKDLGVRPAHAQKLLAVLKGKGPPGRSFAELIH
ncbi:uncharacterized protein LOC134181085 [Corticium candelabrum]|uniref:uncharacterized protein LOC134181085 n=1 Tax=Corticium candelabrum TaxID=121492 RepID=UPI002E26711A|nr:uncharacterized protein LOC134181085 [Corticium candelabrum]